MLVKNNWITTNIRDRLTNKNVDFEVTINPYQEYFSQDFHAACLNAARNIHARFHKVFLSMSGGLDSAYMYKVFHEAGNDFTPIIVRVENNVPNSIEIKEALRLVNTYGPEPIVIDITEKQLVDIFYHNLFKPLNCRGLYSVPSIVAAQVAHYDGVLITGEHFFDETAPGHRLRLTEFDVCIDAVINPDVLVPFYLYNQDVVWHMIKPTDHRDWKIWKKATYGDQRDIPPHQLTDPLLNTIAQSIWKKINATGTRWEVELNRQQLIERINPL